MSGISCLACGQPTDGRLRAALWEEEEKGRLVARGIVLCPGCHASFLAGTLLRAELARKFHADRGYQPAEWIGRIDRDTLLDIACLGCGVLLPVESPAAAEIACPHCKAVNLIGDRTTVAGTFRLTVSLQSVPEAGSERG